MSIFLNDVARTEFDTEVKHAYRAAANLRSTVTFRGGVAAGTYDFRSMGAGIAKQKASQDDVVPMNVAHAVQAATLADWHAAEYTDIFNAAAVNFDEQRELATTIAEAIARREDQLVIDALATAAVPAGQVVANSIGGTSTSLNTAKLRRASKIMNANGVPKADRHYICNADALEALLGTTEATSIDYNGVKALVDGALDTFLGFKFHIIPTQDEGGLALRSANNRESFAYHQRAIGLACALDRSVTVDWVAQKRSWLACQDYKAGAIARDAAAASANLRGIVEVRLYE